MKKKIKIVITYPKISPPGHHWVPSSTYGGLPANAVIAGNDADGSPIYIGRTYHEGDQLPVKVVPSRQNAYVTYAGQEINVTNYEVLVGHELRWVHSASGHVPDGALTVGNLASGEPVYVGRAHFQGSLTPGKVHRSHGCLYIGFGGQEHRVESYEVLVSQQKGRWIPVSGGSAVPFRAVLAGRDIDGSNLYVGRAHHEGELLPAKVTHNRAYVAHGGREHAKYDYEVLCEGQHSWVPSGNGAPAPFNAVRAGSTSSGEPLYVGRGWHAGNQMPGKVHCSHGCLYVPFGGEEHRVDTYEILVEH